MNKYLKVAELFDCPKYMDSTQLQKNMSSFMIVILIYKKVVSKMVLIYIYTSCLSNMNDIVWKFYVEDNQKLKFKCITSVTLRSDGTVNQTNPQHLNTLLLEVDDHH
jgi:hypothetical protein